MSGKTRRELDDAVVAACESVARQLRGMAGTGERLSVTVWLACDCQRESRSSLVNIGSVVVCNTHGQQRVIDVIE